METNSGVKFTEAQVALAAQFVAGDHLTTQKEIIIVSPEDESLVPAAKPQAQNATEKILIPQDQEAARRVIEQFEAGANHLRSDDPVSDSVAQHMLTSTTSLLDEKWLGTEEEELYA